MVAEGVQSILDGAYLQVHSPLIVMPELDTVVVFTGGNYNSSVPVETIMERHIVPAIAP